MNLKINMFLVIMLKYLPYECLFEVYEFLYNHEIINMLTLSKEINQKTPLYLIIDFMNYRVHPIVFNSHNHYCFVCNQGLIFDNEDNRLENVKCYHI